MQRHNCIFSSIEVLQRSDTNATSISDVLQKAYTTLKKNGGSTCEQKYVTGQMSSPLDPRPIE